MKKADALRTISLACLSSRFSRYEHASTVLTSNKGFEEWGAILSDEVMAAALIDRLMRHCHVVNIRGNSYRMREHTDLWKAMQPENQASDKPRRRRKEGATPRGSSPHHGVQFSAATNEQFSSGVDRRHNGMVFTVDATRPIRRDHAR